MKIRSPIFVVALVAVAGIASPALAYVGPGAGLSVIGALIGVVLAVGAAAVFVVGWPIRRMMRRRKQALQTRAEPLPGMRAARDHTTTPRDSARSTSVR